MTQNHTPGPWTYELEYGPNITEPPRITTVARCANFVIGLPCDYPGGDYRYGDPSGDEEADALLIAAAPELLEALELCINAMFPGCPDEEWSIAYEKACAAIAKATNQPKE